MVDAERTRRLNLWQLILSRYNSTGIQPSMLHKLKIFVGGQGTWRDTENTRELADNGVTIGVLHTGKHYPDDWSSDGVIYHYPRTDRHSSFDHNEIEATKAAGTLSLPIFVISHNPKNQKLRDVHLGWIAGWDDTAEVFLILFQSEPPHHLISSQEDEGKFELFDDRPRKRGERNIRDNQAEFRFKVLQRYGAKCALCDVEVGELLEAIHLVPKSKLGTDDPRNGLILCVLHHKAFDLGLIGIDPSNTHIFYPSKAINKHILGVKFDDLQHLQRLPHKDALSWNWKRFRL